MYQKIASKFGNGVRKKLLKDHADDTGCGIKVFGREAFLRLPYFDHIHRYIPALMLREGYVTEFRDVNHRSREFGVSKYTNFGFDSRWAVWAEPFREGNHVSCIYSFPAADHSCFDI